jgi:hypothetical protein
MLTYQDMLKAADKPAFVMEAISNYRSLDMYIRAVEAQAYYSRDNTGVVRRLTFMEKFTVKGSKVKFFKMRCGFFPKIIKQQSQYLLGNGITVDDKIKTMLGNKVDTDFQRAGLYALIDGVSWCFWNVDRLIVFRATEFAPLFDEETSALMAGIRFWQLSPDKPMFIELYEMDGVTRFQADQFGSVPLIIKPKTAYKQQIRIDAVSKEVVNTENYTKIPVFPFYANELKQTEFTYGLQEDIDAYDFISSDLVDNILQIEGIYWVIKNYGGDDLKQLRDEIAQIKMTYTDGDNAGADSHTIEVPYNAKQVALNLIETKMYRDTMSLDTRVLTGGSLTNIAIKVAMTDLNLKTDLFEYQAIDTLQNILSLLGYPDEQFQFKRRSITNDTEMVQNISMMLSDGYVDDEWAVENNPLIADESQKELLDRLDATAQEAAQAAFPLGGGADMDAAAPTAQEVTGAAEQVSGKALSGVQTQSLIAVIGQYAAGAITIGQAVNLIAVSIGISKEEAQKIIEGTA